MNTDTDTNTSVSAYCNRVRIHVRAGLRVVHVILNGYDMDMETREIELTDGNVSKETFPFEELTLNLAEI